ncbi:hypothetical protein GCM10018780_90100 [Streptomyces lanatus]|nr:hypothetical protein GCM10018780_90100 [Streptomyces lanatus]
MPRCAESRTTNGETRVDENPDHQDQRGEQRTHPPRPAFLAGEDGERPDPHIFRGTD